MPFLVRTINRENWPEPNEISDISKLSADALKDLNTTNNELSVWEVDSEDDVWKGVLAYIASRNSKVTDDVDIVVIKEDDLKDKKLSVTYHKNPTNFMGMEDKHKDILELDYKSMGNLASVIIKALDEEKDRICSKIEVDEWFKKAIQEGYISSSKIDKDRFGALRKYVITIEDQLD